MTSAQLPACYDQFLKVIDDRDTDAFLDMFTAHGSVNDWGHRYVGREAIRAWSDREFLGVRMTLAVDKAVDVDGRVTITGQVGGGGFNGPSTFVLVTEGDRLREMLITA